MYSLENEKDAAGLMMRDTPRIILRMVDDFSTWEPFGLTLRKQLNLIGFFLRTYVGASKIFHFFTNPELPCVDWLPIGENDTQFLSDFTKEGIVIKVETSEVIREIQEKKENQFWSFCSKLAPKQRYLLLPFSQHNCPFGHFIMAFEGDLPGRDMRVKLCGTLNVLQEYLQILFYNHYPITQFSYLPDFQKPRSTESAILFCDIRNSTEMFEIARMTEEEEYTDMIVKFLKNLLNYASRVISVPNIGRIRQFMGDGFWATFGEHLTASKSPNKPTAACSLVLLVAKLLVEGFGILWGQLQRHQMYRKFIGKYNEDPELRLGIGVNYGKIKFDFFGIAMEQTQSSQSPRGFCDFNAVGDHVNFASRLCSVASQPLYSVNYLYRNPSLPENMRLTAPIIASKTITINSLESLSPNLIKIDPLVVYKTGFVHKGKWHMMPGFEIYPENINHHKLLRSIFGVHNNHFHDALEKLFIKDEEGYNSELRKVSEKFANDLDDIYKT